MIRVELKDGETVDRALRKFKKKVERSRVLREVRERSFYQKPSEVRKAVLSRAINRQRKFAEENY